MASDEATILGGLSRATNQVRDVVDIDVTQREKVNVEKRLKDLEEKVSIIVFPSCNCNPL